MLLELGHLEGGVPTGWLTRYALLPTPSIADVAPVADDHPVLIRLFGASIRSCSLMTSTCTERDGACECISVALSMQLIKQRYCSRRGRLNIDRVQISSSKCPVHEFI